MACPLVERTGCFIRWLTQRLQDRLVNQRLGAIGTWLSMEWICMVCWDWGSGCIRHTSLCLWLSDDVGANDGRSASSGTALMIDGIACCRTSISNSKSETELVWWDGTEWQINPLPRLGWNFVPNATVVREGRVVPVIWAALQLNCRGTKRQVIGEVGSPSENVPRRGRS